MQEINHSQQRHPGRRAGILRHLAPKIPALRGSRRLSGMTFLDFWEFANSTLPKTPYARSFSFSGSYGDSSTIVAS